MTKKMSVSSRIDEKKFEDFKSAYVQNIQNTLQKVDPVITADMLQVSNSELLDRAVTLAIAYLRQQGQRL